MNMDVSYNLSLQPLHWMVQNPHRDLQICRGLVRSAGGMASSVAWCSSGTSFLDLEALLWKSHFRCLTIWNMRVSFSCWARNLINFPYCHALSVCWCNLSWCGVKGLSSPSCTSLFNASHSIDKIRLSESFSLERFKGNMQEPSAKPCIIMYNLYVFLEKKGDSSYQLPLYQTSFHRSTALVSSDKVHWPMCCPRTELLVSPWRSSRGGQWAETARIEDKNMTGRGRKRGKNMKYMWNHVDF